MSVAGGVGQVILEGAVTVVSVEEAEVGLAAREIHGLCSARKRLEKTDFECSELLFATQLALI